MLQRFLNLFKSKQPQETPKPKMTFTQALLRCLKDKQKNIKHIWFDDNIEPNVMVKSIYFGALISNINFPLIQHVNRELWEKLLPTKSQEILVKYDEFKEFAEFCNDNGLIWQSKNTMLELNPFDGYVPNSTTEIIMVLGPTGYFTYNDEYPNDRVNRVLTVHDFKKWFLELREVVDNNAMQIFNFD